jgi:hypothetical protein
MEKELRKRSNEDSPEGFPKRMNFVCPSCAISYGINAFVTAIKKRKAKDTTTTKTELTNQIIYVVVHI